VKVAAEVFFQIAEDCSVAYEIFVFEVAAEGVRHEARGMSKNSGSRLPLHASCLAKEEEWILNYRKS